ncbi:MAG: serine hydrolase [Paludibacter sp.]
MRKIIISLLFVFPFVLYSQSVYYPPLNTQAPWESVSPASLGWSADKIGPLYDFLEKENTKAFIVLKNGKIVLEKYFGTFKQDSVWYWASAGKTITSFLIGTAQEAGYLDIDDPSNKYLGAGWTNCTPDQENAIKIRHQLSMTSGLDDGVADNHCTLPLCLKHLADPGKRWAYHNAPYTLLEKVLENATAININLYTQSKLKAKTGITGIWAMLDSDNVFFSTARSMARYGLLAQEKFVWERDTLLRDTAYVRAMTTTSQNLNKSYGYLWWLNGKESYMLPTLQYVFQGSYAPEAPVDMFAGLGKNGQIVSVSPAQGLVVVRMGNQPGGNVADITPQFCNQIWERLNDVIYNRTAIDEVISNANGIKIYPNSSGDSMKLEFVGICERLVVFDMMAKPVKIFLSPKSPLNIEVGSLPKGVYLVQLKSGVHAPKTFFIRK